MIYAPDGRGGEVLKLIDFQGQYFLMFGLNIERVSVENFNFQVQHKRI